MHLSQQELSQTNSKLQECYRPISLLSVFKRIMEKLIYNGLISFIEKMDIIYAKQFGFRSHHSTEPAILLLSIVDKIHEGIEKGMFSCGIFLDFSKAFDTVNHSILIRKLEHYGVRGIAKDWFVSYLSNRRQFTSIGAINSEVCQFHAVYLRVQSWDLSCS